MKANITTWKQLKGIKADLLEKMPRGRVLLGNLFSWMGDLPSSLPLLQINATNLKVRYQHDSLISSAHINLSQHCCVTTRPLSLCLDSCFASSLLSLWYMSPTHPDEGLCMCLLLIDFPWSSFPTCWHFSAWPHIPAHWPFLPTLQLTGIQKLGKIHSTLPSSLHKDEIVPTSASTPKEALWHQLLVRFWTRLRPLKLSGSATLHPLLIPPSKHTSLVWF